MLAYLHAAEEMDAAWPMFSTPISIYNVIRPGTDKTFFETLYPGQSPSFSSAARRWAEKVALKELEPGDPRWFAPKLRKCKSAMVAPYPGNHMRWMGTLENAYAGANAKRPDGSMVCPHRGAPLDDLGTRGGCIECPLHGLRWHPRTGEMIPWDSTMHGHEEAQ